MVEIHDSWFVIHDFSLTSSGCLLGLWAGLPLEEEGVGLSGVEGTEEEERLLPDAWRFREWEDPDSFFWYSCGFWSAVNNKGQNYTNIGVFVIAVNTWTWFLFHPINLIHCLRVVFRMRGGAYFWAWNMYIIKKLKSTASIFLMCLWNHLLIPEPLLNIINGTFKRNTKVNNKTKFILLIYMIAAATHAFHKMMSIPVSYL